MKRRRNNRTAIKLFIGIICIAIFSSLGVTYAAWSDSIKTNIYINTGKIDVDFDCFYFERYCFDYFYWLIACPETCREDVVKTTGVVPKGTYRLNFTLENKGTLPVIFLEPEIEVTENSWCSPYGLEMSLNETASRSLAVADSTDLSEKNFKILEASLSEDSNTIQAEADTNVNNNKEAQEVEITLSKKTNSIQVVTESSAGNDKKSETPETNLSGDITIIQSEIDNKGSEGLEESLSEDTNSVQPAMGSLIDKDDKTDISEANLSETVSNVEPVIETVENNLAEVFEKSQNEEINNVQPPIKVIGNDINESIISVQSLIGAGSINTKKPKGLVISLSEDIDNVQVNVLKMISRKLIFKVDKSGYYSYEVRIPYTYSTNNANNPIVDGKWVKELIIRGVFWID